MKIAIAALALLGAAGQDVKDPQPDPALRGSGWEMRVFVLEKGTLKSVDLSDWSATMDIEPRGGKNQKVTLQRWGKDMPRRDDDRAKAEPKVGVKPMVCGQVKDMDPYYVEVVVVPTGWMEKGLKDHGKAAPVDGNGDGDGEGYRHSHGGTYFKADLPRSWWTDAKGGALAFDADVHFAYGKDKKSVKGFSYPYGLYKDALQKVMDEDLKQARDYVKANDSAKWKEVAERIHCKTSALPDLWFKKDEDRQEFEKAKSECMAACERLRNAPTTDEAKKAIDDCADKCDDYQDQAQDAEGVNWEFKGWEHHKRSEPKPSDTPRK